MEHGNSKRSGPPRLARPIVGYDDPRWLNERARGRLPGSAVLRWHLPRGSSAVALTFDDGPHPTGTPAVLEVLAANRARASFFVLTESVKKRVAVLHEAAAAGHEIGLHGDAHDSLARLLPRQSEQRLIGARHWLEDTLQSPVELYWPPYGITSVALLRAARRVSLEVVLWSRDPRDWDESWACPPADRLARCIEPGAIVLLHNGRRDSSVEPWAAALSVVLPAARTRGLRFCSLSEATAPTQS